MPFIGTKVSVPLSNEKEMKMKERLGQAISVFPGKTEKFLMLEFEDNCHLYFGGSNSAPLAYVEVKILGNSTKEYFSKMSYEICKILEDELDISPENVYIKYEEVTHWGWNSTNF